MGKLGEAESDGLGYASTVAAAVPAAEFVNEGDITSCGMEGDTLLLKCVREGVGEEENAAKVAVLDKGDGVDEALFVALFASGGVRIGGAEEIGGGKGDGQGSMLGKLRDGLEARGSIVFEGAPL